MHVLGPTQVRINITYVRKTGSRWHRKTTIGSRNRRKRGGQAGYGLNLATNRDLGKRVTDSHLGKTIISDAVDYPPTVYKKIKNKINKKVKAVMNTGFADYLVNKGIELIGETFN